MDLLSLPDIAGMLVLMGILGWVRRRYGAQSVNLWVLGLALVLISNVAGSIHPQGMVKAWVRLVSLDTFVLAGMTFAFAAGQDRMLNRQLIPVVAAPAVPLLVLTSSFGLGRASSPFCGGVIFSALLVGSICIAWADFLKRGTRRILFAVHCAIWLPMFAMALHAGVECAVYWGLGCLFLLVAASFRNSIRRDGVGGLVIVAGFSLWAACLLLHPVLQQHALLSALADRVRAMQRFFVILGMLLVLLETQTRLRLDEAMHDPLTGLPNRRLFEDRLSQALERSRRSGLTTALITLDLNGFKQINDTLGHQHGDLVLKETARHLRSRVRVSDTLARCGGDEFSVILSDLAQGEDCERVLENLRMAVAAGGDQRHAITCSIGCALFPQEAADAETLAELADRRMYEHKRSQLPVVASGTALLLTVAG